MADRPVGPSLLVRADGGPATGAGHLGRGLALGQAWADLHGTASLVTRSIPDHWRARFLAEHLPVLGPEELQRSGVADWYALDGYRFGGHDVELARASAAHLLVVGDHGWGADAPADLYLDQNLGARIRQPAAVAVLGPRYALLRRDFRERLATIRAGAAAPAPPDGPVRRRDTPVRLLVSLGGLPGTDDLEVATDVVAKLPARQFDVHWLDGRVDVLPQLEWADLALSAAGSTTWELCAFGVPTVLVTIAENQVAGAEALGGSGAVVAAGPLVASRVPAIASLIGSLGTDRERRASLGARGRALVDGQGAIRVCTRMRARLLTIEDATERDAKLLWTWANDEDVRRVSFSHDPVPWEHHVVWLRRLLADPAARQYLAYRSGGVPVGQVRFEPLQPAAPGTRCAVLSYSLAPESRGHGWGGALVEAAVHRLFTASDVEGISARTLTANDRSVRSLLAADFDEQPVAEGETWRTFWRPRDPLGPMPTEASR